MTTLQNFMIAEKFSHVVLDFGIGPMIMDMDISTLVSFLFDYHEKILFVYIQSGQ